MIAANQLFDFIFDHDGFETTEYRMLVDGVEGTVIPVSSLSSGSGFFVNQSIASPGSYELRVRVVYVDATTADSDPFNLTVDPQARIIPTNLRVYAS